MQFRQEHQKSRMIALCCGMIQVAIADSEQANSPSIMDVTGHVIVINWDHQIVMDRFIKPLIPPKSRDYVYCRHDD
jgi:hypothetical protein